MSKNEVRNEVKIKSDFFRQTSNVKALKKELLATFILYRTRHKHTAVLNYFAAQSVSLYNYNESDKEQLCDDFVLSLWNDQY
jgi:hypothetical protein